MTRLTTVLVRDDDEYVTFRSALVEASSKWLAEEVLPARSKEEAAPSADIFGP